MMHASSKPYENHHLILEHIDSHMSHEMDDHIPQYYKKSSISSTSSPEPPHHMYRPQMPPQHQQFRVIKDTRQIYDDGGYQVSSSEHSKIMEIDQPMAPPPPQIHAAVHNNAVDVPTQKVKIINSNEEPTSSIPDLEFDGTNVLCRVCGDKASGFHYGGTIILINSLPNARYLYFFLFTKILAN